MPLEELSFTIPYFIFPECCVVRLPPELRVNLQISRNYKRKRTGKHYDNEEHTITHCLLQGTGKESRYHHRKSHKGRTQSIVRRLVLTLTIIYKILLIG